MIPFDAFHYSVICRESFRYPFYQHDDWTVYVPVQGEFLCTFEGKTDVVCEGDVYVIPPHTPFQRKVLRPLTVHFFRFTLKQEPSVPIPCGRFSLRSERGRETLRLLRETLHATEKEAEILQKHYLTDLFMQHYSESVLRSEYREISDETVQRVLDLFHRSYAECCSMGEIARQVGLSPSGLIKKFRKEVGVPPLRYLIGLRIRKAKELLVNTTVGIGEIAEQTGFENIYYFSKIFKKETSLSPMEYRKQQTL